MKPHGRLLSPVFCLLSPVSCLLSPSRYNLPLTQPACDYSVVVPVLNEEQTIPEMCARLSRVVASTGGTWEVIYVNDGSTDRSFATLARLRTEYPFLKALDLSRNFGHQAALCAGIEAADPTADAFVILDGDGQHPCQLIPDMLRLHLRGVDIVRTTRIDDENAGTPWKRWISTRRPKAS